MALSVTAMTVAYSTYSICTGPGRGIPILFFGQHLQTYYAWAVPISFVLAIIGMFRDRNVWMGTGALVLSMFGLFVAATG
jgi:hypothetical protein